MKVEIAEFAEPFWGAPTCINDSREPNYMHTNYVAELVATTTCVPWLIVSGIGFAGSKGLPVRVAYALHFLSALFGVAYHATLGLAAQVLDRCSVMCWMICMLLFLIRLDKSNRLNHGSLRAASMVIASSVAVLSPLLSLHNLHVPVFVGIVAMMVFAGRPVARMYTAHAHMWEWALLLALPALLCFAMDEVTVVANLFDHWHSMWHAFALYSTAFFMGFVRSAQANRQGHTPCTAFMDLSMGLPIYSSSSK